MNYAFVQLLRLNKKPSLSYQLRAVCHTCRVPSAHCTSPDPNVTITWIAQSVVSSAHPI